MSKKRGRSKKQPVQVQAIPEEFLAEGSGPIGDIEAISGIQPADTTAGDLAGGPEVRAAHSDDENDVQGASSAQSDGELTGQSDGELTAHDGSDGELTAHDGSDGELTAQTDSDSGLSARTDSDSGLIARADSDSELTARADSDGELTARADSDGELTARADSDGELTAKADSDSDGELTAEADSDRALTSPGDSDNDGELTAQGDGELTAQGDGELTAEGDGELTAQGDGELTAQGDGEGEGEGVDGEAATMPTSAASMDVVQFKQLVEALVFASDKPITVQRLRQLTRVSDVARIQETLADIAADYAERGLVLQQVSGGYQFRTRPQFSAWVQQLIAGRPVRLSRAQLETLAIIAYRQPITRPEIDDIRGVDSSATLKLLMDRLLIRVLGKKEEVGRPMLYGTTREFLDFFSLGDLRELPTLREYSELSDESRKVMSSRLGIGMEGEGGGGSSGSDGSDDGDDNGGGDNGGGGSGSGGSSGGGGDGDGDGGTGDGGTGDLGDLGDPEILGDHDGRRSDIRASSLSDLAARVLASAAAEGSDVESALADSANERELMMPTDGDPFGPANDDDASMSASSDALDAAHDGTSSAGVAVDDADEAGVASDESGRATDGSMIADANDGAMTADAASDESMTDAMAGDDTVDASAANDGAVLAGAASDDVSHAFEVVGASAESMSADEGDAHDANHVSDESMSAHAGADDESLSAGDSETLSVDAATPHKMPIIVEDVIDGETRDRPPVTEAMTLADAPDLERSETRIVDPLIAAEVLAHAETNVSSGESPE